MMTSRMALGSVSTLACGALLLGAMPYLVSRTMGASPAAPWGAISGLKVESIVNTSTSADDQRAQLLRLASLKTENPPSAVSAPPVTPVEAPSATDDTPPQVSASESADSPSKDVPKDLPMDGTTLTGTPVQMRAVSSSDVEINTASIDPSRDAAKPSPAVRTATSSSSAVNINTASTDLLDRFPGVGRIGHAIVVHRPYRDVSDLVRRRVLRMSDFQKIQSRIRVD